MRSLMVLTVMLLCFGGLQGDLTAQEDEPETVIVSVDSTNLRFSPSSVTITEGDTVRFFWSGQARLTTLWKTTACLIRVIPSETWTTVSRSNAVPTARTSLSANRMHRREWWVKSPSSPLLLNETTEEEQPVSVDTPSLSMVATLGVLALAGMVRSGRQGNG